MRYALLIYSAPEASVEESSTDDGVYDDWVAYTRALKSAGGVFKSFRRNDENHAVRRWQQDRARHFRPAAHRS